MIPASEALRLPTAVLTDEEREAATLLETEIEKHVVHNMSFRGVDIQGKETRSNVLSAVNRRLTVAGYNAQWQIIIEKHPLNAALTKAVGFKLALAPNDEAYLAAERTALS